MVFKNISIVNENFDIENNVNVYVSNGIIEKIEPYDSAVTLEGDIICGKNKLLMSGFYNTHTHLPMTLMRGYGENLPLDRWLNEKIFPFEYHLNSEHTYNASLLGIAELLKYGTVSISDMYFYSDSIAKAVIESGIKANISRSVVCFDESSAYDLDNFKEQIKLFEDYNNYDNGRIKIETSLHAEYTCTLKAAREVSEYSSEHNLGMQIHVSETLKEHNECLNRHGMTPTEFFYKASAFSSHVTAAHCVYLSDNDIKIFKESGASIAHCPVSNLKLGSGVAPIGKYIENGINVTLGTDSVASNNNTNILEEIKLAAVLHKGINKNPVMINEKQALKMATVNAALAQNRNGGVIKQGMPADIIMINTDAPNMQPCHNLLTNIVYSMTPSEIEMTMVNGKILYHNNEYKTIDIDKAIFYANKSKNTIIGKIKYN